MDEHRTQDSHDSVSHCDPDRYTSLLHTTMIESKIIIQREQQLDIFAFLKKDLLEQL
jgi:hypothetical protein